MLLKQFFLIFLIFNFSFASFQEVRIGKIDDFYKNKISKEELKSLLDEIEYIFESTFGMEVFDYSANGKAIDILYVPPSKLEKRISSKLQQLKNKEKKIKRLQNSFSSKQKEIKSLKNIFSQQNDYLSKQVKKFNDYVKEINRRKNVSKREYKEIQSYVKRRKTKLDKDLRVLKRDKRDIQRVINSYNQKIRSLNVEIRQYKRLNKELEAMGRKFKKIKGMTFGVKEIKVKTYYKNGKRVKEKTQTNSMNKIEIYGFDSLSELKAILAHEIGHLVGLPHISSKNALMNPIIQKNQLRKLELTNSDKINFRKNF